MQARTIWQKQDVEDSIFDEDELIGKPQDNYQQVVLRLRYRRNVWRDWLYVEFWPAVAWPEERDWETVLAGLFRLEVTYGGKGKSNSANNGQPDNRTRNPLEKPNGPTLNYHYFFRRPHSDGR